MTGTSDLSDEQIELYARHLILDQVGEDGQLALMNSKILVVGAGGIGSPALFYLNASGVGEIHIVDDDQVDLSNLQRQILFLQSDKGLPKAQAAQSALNSRNADVRVIPHVVRLDRENIDDLFTKTGVDLVIDGSDSFETRHLVAAACLRFKIPLVSSAASQFDGQLAVYRPWLENRPCYTCLFPNPPASRTSCAEVGVFATVTGMLGTMAAHQALLILMNKEVDDQRLLLVDGQNLGFSYIKAFKRKNCEICRA